MAHSMVVWSGETIRIHARFTTESGAPMAATGVTIVAKDPTGATVSGSVVPDEETGLFHADFLVEAPGVWYVRSHCTGPTAAAEEDRFTVRKSYVV